jgi:heat shock protein HtpX
MMRRDIGKDTQLQVRMIITLFLLGLVYGSFIYALFSLGAAVPVILVFAIVLVGVQFMLSNRMVLLSMRAKVVSAEEEPKLHDMVERLAWTASLPKPRIALSRMAVPNAFATGRSAKSATVAVTTGLQELLTDREMEAVLAHEISHIKHRDMEVMTYASFFAVVASTLMSMFFWMGLFGGFSGRGSRQGGGNIMMMAYMITIVVWLVSQLLLAALSRYREFAADRGAAILTGRPADLASALTRISGTIARVPKDDLRKAASMNAFFILPAIGGGLANLFATHPKVTKRIEQLRAIEAAMGL